MLNCCLQTLSKSIFRGTLKVNYNLMLINRAINQNLLRFLVIVFFSILFILCLNTCFAFAAKQSNDSSRLDTVTLKLKWKHQFQFAGYYAALKKGFYQDAGLKVKIEEASDYTESTEAVLAGKADFGIGASDLVVNRVKGQPIVVLASIFQHSPLVLLTKQDKGINQIHDIVGKRVMIEPHSDDLFAYLKDEGISKNQLILYPHYFDITPLMNNEVDAISAYLTDEIYLLKKQKISYNVFSPKSAGIDFYGDTLFTTEKQIREHPERVRKFLDASLRGWKYVFQNEQNMKDIIDLIYESYSKRHTREHLSYEAEKMRSFVIPEIVEIGYMYPGRWQHIAETYAKLGIIPQKFSLEGFIYNKIPKDYLQLYSLKIGVIIVVIILSFVGLCSIISACHPVSIYSAVISLLKKIYSAVISLLKKVKP